MSKVLASGVIQFTCSKDPQIGTRNLVRDSKDRKVVAPSDNDRYNAVGYRMTTGLVSTHRSYAVSANIEVLAGEIGYITAYIYDAHAPQRARYDKSKGGGQRLTWVFDAEIDSPERISRHPLWIYAGVNGHTISNSIAVSDLIVVEGNVPPQSWTPAPEDLETKSKEQARIEALKSQRRQLAIDLEQLRREYASIRTHKRLSKDLGIRLEQLWITARGAHQALDRACSLAIAKPTDDNITTIDRLTEEYKTALSSYTQGLEDTKSYLGVDSLKIGGRNLVLQSGTAKTSNVYHVGTWQLSEGWQADTEYTIVVWGRCSGASSQPLDIYPNTGRYFLAQVVVPAGETALLGYVTVMMPQSKIYAGAERELRLYAMSNHPNRGGSVEYVIERIAVVKGNIPPQSWSPAPEDIAEEAQRKANEAERRAKEHAERQIAHMDYLKAVLRKGQASIQGGAILGQYIAVADLEQVVRGYISGMLNGVFLAAGVSNHGTPQETRNVEISHDGDGHFGQLHFCGSGQDGRVDLIRPGETDPYLSLGGVLRPIQEVLLDAELRDTYISNQADVDAYPLALSGLTRELKVFSVLRDGASCRVSGQLQAPSMRFNGAGDSQQSQRVTITTEILLQRQQPSSWIDVAVMGDVWVSGSSSQDYWSGESKVIDLRLPNLPKGQYRLMAQSKYSDNYYSLQVISQIRIMPLTILVERVSSVQQVAFTEQGFRAFYGPRRYVDIASEGNYVLSARGATDIPGVLAAGRVSAEGQVTTSWGAYCNRPGYNNARAELNSDSSYTVYHSIGHTNYIVQLTTEESWNLANYYDVRPNSFRVRLQNPTQSFSRYFPNPFSYVCIGNNRGQS